MSKGTLKSAHYIMCYGLPKFDKSKIMSAWGQISNFDVTFYIQSVFDQLNQACSNSKIIPKLVKIEDENRFSYRSPVQQQWL